MSNKQLCLCVSVCVPCLCFSPSSTANCHLVCPVWGNKRQKKNSCRGTFKQPKGIFLFLFSFFFSPSWNFWDMDAYSLMSITVVGIRPTVFLFLFLIILSLWRKRWDCVGRDDTEKEKCSFLIRPIDGFLCFIFSPFLVVLSHFTSPFIVPIYRTTSSILSPCRPDRPKISEMERIRNKRARVCAVSLCDLLSVRCYFEWIKKEGGGKQ